MVAIDSASFASPYILAPTPAIGMQPRPRAETRKSFPRIRYFMSALQQSVLLGQCVPRFVPASPGGGGRRRDVPGNIAKCPEDVRDGLHSDQKEQGFHWYSHGKTDRSDGG